MQRKTIPEEKLTINLQDNLIKTSRQESSLKTYDTWYLFKGPTSTSYVLELLRLPARSLKCVLRPWNVSPYFTIVQTMGHKTYSDRFKYRIPHKPVSVGRMQPRKLHYCIWRELIKPGLRFFSLFCVFFVSKGSLFLFHLDRHMSLRTLAKISFL